MDDRVSWRSVPDVKSRREAVEARRGHGVCGGNCIWPGACASETTDGKHSEALLKESAVPLGYWVRWAGEDQCLTRPQTFLPLKSRAAQINGPPGSAAHAVCFLTAAGEDCG